MLGSEINGALGGQMHFKIHKMTEIKNQGQERPFLTFHTVPILVWKSLSFGHLYGEADDFIYKNLLFTNLPIISEKKSNLFK